MTALLPVCAASTVKSVEQYRLTLKQESHSLMTYAHIHDVLVFIVGPAIGAGSVLFYQAARRLSKKAAAIADGIGGNS